MTLTSAPVQSDEVEVVWLPSGQQAPSLALVSLEREGREEAEQKIFL